MHPHAVGDHLTHTHSYPGMVPISNTLTVQQLLYSLTTVLFKGKGNTGPQCTPFRNVLEAGWTIL